MISLFWLFVGAIVGLLMVSVFFPPPRKVPSLPTPDNDKAFFTDTGCVKMIPEEVECMPSATSLNFLASENK
jgi:hypothetical protein